MRLSIILYICVFIFKNVIRKFEPNSYYKLLCLLVHVCSGTYMHDLNFGKKLTTVL